MNGALDWLGETPGADLDDLLAKKEEVEHIVHPIFKDLYNKHGTGAAAGADHNDDPFDFGDDEL